MANGHRRNLTAKKSPRPTVARFKTTQATIAKAPKSKAVAEPVAKPKTTNGTAKVAAANVAARVQQALSRVAKKTNKQKTAEPKQPLAAEKKGDRVVLLVRDAYWLHVFWEMTDAGVRRIEAAFGQEWYGATAILRLLDVSSDDTPCASERIVRDVPIRNGARNWYLEIDGSPKNYRADIGFRTAGGRFFTLARSNIVASPRPGRAQAVDPHWQSIEEDCERIFALTAGSEENAARDELKAVLEERIQRPLNAGSLSEYGRGALDVFRTNHFNFDMDAELIVHGKTVPHAHVTLEGEPINIRADGSFTLRYRLPDGRQVLPVVAKSSDGIEERTIILAVERNTKLLEPTVHDGQD